MYKAKFCGGEWVIVDADGVIISEIGEFANKAEAKAAAAKLNSESRAQRAERDPLDDKDDLGASCD